MEPYLLTTSQAVAIVMFVSCVFGLLWTIQGGRIDTLKDKVTDLEAEGKAKDDEIKRLNDQQKNFTQLEAELNSDKERAAHEIKILQAEIEKTKTEGDEKTNVTLKESLKVVLAAVKKIEELQKQVDEMKPYKEKWEENERRRKAIADGLSQIRLSDTSNLKGFPNSETLSGYLESQYPKQEPSSLVSAMSLGPSLPMFQAPLYCMACSISPSKCSKCGISYCNEHMPLGSIGTFPNFVCGKCIDPLKAALGEVGKR